MAEQRVQRRLAAIMVADVVGYSRLMREDEAGTLAQLKTLRKELLDPKVEEFGGRIVKTTGDGILIEFPSAVAAVSNASPMPSSARAPRGQRASCCLPSSASAVRCRRLRWSTSR